MKIIKTIKELINIKREQLQLEITQTKLLNAIYNELQRIKLNQLDFISDYKINSAPTYKI